MPVIMPSKEYFFLKDKFSILDHYVINVAYTKDEVSLDFLDNKKEQFKVEYQSLIKRVGLNGKESFNETGVHLNNIYEQYIVDQIDI